MKNAIIFFAIVIVVGIAGYFLFLKPSEEVVAPTEVSTATSTQDVVPPTAEERKPVEVIGRSADGRDIVAYHFGTGDTELLFVGGIHGGYEWNTALVAFELMDYLGSTQSIVPENVRVTVVPVLNPDGLHRTINKEGRFTKADVKVSLAESVSGRFNGNNVDLNRNFDCEWQPEGAWQDKTVSGGSKPFSEPESQAIQAYVAKHKPAAAVVWYSAAGGVFASNCKNGILPGTQTIMKLYSDASRYPAYDDFDFYEVTGDMVNWLAKNGIPAVSVLLTNHTDTEWSKNKAGVDALLKHFGN